MNYSIQTPAEIWKHYNPTKEPLQARCNFETLEINRARTLKDYVFLGETMDDGEILVFCRAYVPIERKGVIILIEDYRTRNNSALIDHLVEQGYAVLTPDYCDRLNCGTKFTASTAYGKISLSGDRLSRMQQSAQDTGQFLYEKLIKRTITFAKSLFADDKVILCGAGLAAELAVMTAGNDMRVDGLILLNGGVYREYLQSNRFEGELTEILDNHTVSWMSGVASAAYAKYVTCPALFLTTTNSNNFDADRMQAVIALLQNAEVSAYHTPGAVETVGQNGFFTLCEWLKRFESGKRLARQPDAKIRYEDETLSVYVKADIKEKPIKTVVYYAFSEYDHRYRNWHQMQAKLMSDAGEYLAVLPIERFSKPVFVLAEVFYEGGYSLSSYITCRNAVETEEDTETPTGRLVLNGADGGSYFCLENDESILTEQGIRQTEPLGLLGATADVGFLLTFVLNETKVDEDAVLQLNFYSPKERQIRLKVVRMTDKKPILYFAEVTVLGASEFYTAVRLQAEMLKNSELKPMENWNDVKALYVETKGAVIGNILFI